MKKIITDVHCINTDAEVYPDMFVIDMDKKQYSRIKQLSALAIEHNVYEIVILKDWGTYFTQEQLDLIDGEGDESINENAFDSNDDVRILMEGCAVHVFKDGFKFSATPRHAGDNNLCSTRIFTFSELNDCDVYVTLS